MNSHKSLSQSHQAVAVAVVGGGPAGLMAAERLSAMGCEVHLFDAMPSVGRKFLLAGRGGLNLTHSEVFEKFLSRYSSHPDTLKPMLEAWGGEQVREWAHGLGVDTFVGTSGRVFPTEMKAAPLLRAWMHRLRHPAQGLAVQFHMRHKLMGIANLSPLNEAPEKIELSFVVNDLSSQGTSYRKVKAQAVVLALGGGSWARLGSDGAWVSWLSQAGVPVRALQPSNCGFHVAGRHGNGWTPFFAERFAGHPFKSVSMHWTTVQGEVVQRRGEFVATQYGLEGSLIYTASADLREAIQAKGYAEFKLDFMPDRSMAQVLKEVAHPRGRRSLSSHLKSRLGLEGVKMALLNELLKPEALQNADQLTAAIKGLTIKLTKTRPLDEAISSAGGVEWTGLGPTLQTKALEGVFCAGEMLDWEAPTGGYLLTACLATGVQAAQAVRAHIKGDEP